MTENALARGVQCHAVDRSGGARATTKEQGCDFLGEIPLDIDIRIRSDEGEPVTASAPDSPQAQRLIEIAARVAEKLDAGAAKPAPRIVVS